MTIPIKTPKKLIEVALPLDDINEAAGKEKSIRHGHPSTLHLWWARRPLAAARAVIFAQMVNDPGYERALGRGVNKERAKVERERLFGIIRRLVKWENLNNENVLEEAREEIRKSWRESCEINRGHPLASELFNPERLPAFHDPFAGGGALPLEAQRLGLESHASDLNPVAVVINKAMIEIPPRFANIQPVGPIPESESQVEMISDWTGPKGLAEDIRRYGVWVRDEAHRRIGHHYQEVTIPGAPRGEASVPIAWLWTRTVRSPNPAYSHVQVPLASSFILSNKAGQQVYVKPIIEGDSYRFEVVVGMPSASDKRGTKADGRGSNFICLLSGTPITGDYIKAEGVAGRIGSKLLAIAVESQRGRVYVDSNPAMEAAALSLSAEWRPAGLVPARLSGGTCVPYGMTEWGNLFSERQLIALTTFSDITEGLVREKVKADAIGAGMYDDGCRLADEGQGATAYADAIAVYLAIAVSRMSSYWSNLTSHDTSREKITSVFARQAIPMVWDWMEGNPFSNTSGNFLFSVDAAQKSIYKIPGYGVGHVTNADAAIQTVSKGKVVSTDPPYYDNIFYADLSDFYYVWLRKSLRSIFPDLFSTIVVPKAEELVATPHRHGGREAAETFFLEGMRKAMHQLASQAHSAFPVTIYYAFKQSDTSEVGTGNTGWETFLEAVIQAGFAITGTWPMRTEMKGRALERSGANALASSIVLVCRPRDSKAPTISRRDFLRELKDELKDAVDVMIGGAEGISPVAPVDLAQAVIGPGMAIFSKYSSVLEADGKPMTVHSALTLINRMLTEGADDFDADTQFCLGWFDEQGWAAGEFGKADVLTRAKGTSVEHVKNAGVIEATAGKVRLLKPAEYPSDWLPENDNNTPVWEALHQLIRQLRSSGESAAGGLLAGMPQRAEPIRNLAYRLYTLCERKGWAEDARAYNELITSWVSIEAASHEKGHLGSQANLDI